MFYCSLQAAARRCGLLVLLGVGAPAADGDHTPELLEKKNHSKMNKGVAAKDIGVVAPLSSSRSSSLQEQNSRPPSQYSSEQERNSSSHDAEGSVRYTLPPGAYRVHGPAYVDEDNIFADNIQGGTTDEVLPLQEAEVELAPVCPEAWTVEDDVQVSVLIEHDEENTERDNNDEENIDEERGDEGSKGGNRDEETGKTHISARKRSVCIMIILLMIAAVVIIPTTIIKVNARDPETSGPGEPSNTSSLLASCRLSARLLPSEGRNEKQFGYYIDLANNTALVGAPAAGKDRSGAAYIFSHDVDSGKWVEEAILTPDGGGESRSEFGVHVSLDETGNTAVVAADQANDGTGAVFVFERLNGTARWSQTANLVPQTSESNSTEFLAPGMQFGDSVDIDHDTIVVGATFPASDSGRGAVYVFERSLSNRSQWDQTAKLTSEEDEGTNARFGRSLQLKGDTMIVGADKDGTNGRNSGAAFIFSRRQEVNSDIATPWIKEGKLVAKDGGPYQYFGYEVDINRSGDKVVISSWKDGAIVSNSTAEKDGKSTQIGAAYVFSRRAQDDTTDLVWFEDAKLVAEDGEAKDRFGNDVAISSDGDSILVGSYHDDERSGSAYFFRQGGGDGDSTWSQQKKLLDESALANDLFGFHVVLDDNQALIGKLGESNEIGIAAGAVYVVNDVSSCFQ
jgi:hypothetical protein